MSASDTLPVDIISQDHHEIAALITAQFRALSWDEEKPADTETLTNAYLEKAQLFSSTRPAQAQSAIDFASRMTALRDNGRLDAFEEVGRGLHIWITGNIAVAMAGCEMHENRTTVTEDISAFLLVKNPDGWSIAAHAWDIVPSIAQAFAANALNAEPINT